MALSQHEDLKERLKKTNMPEALLSELITKMDNWHELKKERKKELRELNKENDRLGVIIEEVTREKDKALNDVARLEVPHDEWEEKLWEAEKDKENCLEAQEQELGEKHQQELLALKAQHRKQLISILEDQLPDGMTNILHQVVAG
jgi:hypothetical protein